MNTETREQLHKAIQEKYKRGIYTLQDFKRFNERQGFNWFKPNTMRFFKSRVSEASFIVVDPDTAYFISSEPSPQGERRFSIRKANLITGNVDTVGEFMEYETMAQARGALKRLVKGK